MNLMDFIIERLSSQIRGFIRDDSGATMTEFVITLPIFVMIFAGVGHLSQLNRAVVRTGGLAYSEMWDQAIEAQKDEKVGVHNSARNSGSAVKENMRVYQGKQSDQGLEQAVEAEANRLGDGLSGDGTLGESNARVRQTRTKVKLNHIHGDVTPNLSNVIGKSKYAKNLFDDGPAAPAFSSPANALGPGISGRGVALAAGSGALYGEVTGKNERSVHVPGKNIKIQQYYNTLVAPRAVDETVATKVARESMERIKAYDDLLGIHEDQPLDEASQQEVDKINGAM